MADLTTWLLARPRSARAGVLACAAVLALAAVTALGLLGWGALSTFAAGALGLVLFGVFLLTWRTVVPEGRRQRWDLKARLRRSARVLLAMALTLVWATVLLLVHPHLPRVSDHVIGALNVVAVLALITLVRATPVEAVAALVEVPDGDADREADAGLGSGSEVAARRPGPLASLRPRRLSGR